jgi:hypothetical protein
MANLFDVANALTTEPESIVSGTFVQWKRTDLFTDYPPASYDLAYNIRLINGAGVDVSIIATSGSDYFLASITSAISSAWSAGTYAWQAFIVRKSDGAKLLIDTGEFELLSNLDQNGADNRSHATIMVQKIQSLLEGKADKDVTSYSIQGRSISKMSITELTDWRDYYRKEVVKERQAADVAAGKGTGSTIKARFL